MYKLTANAKEFYLSEKSKLLGKPCQRCGRNLEVGDYVRVLIDRDDKVVAVQHYAEGLGWHSRY